jgi:hypothetical protein
MDSVGDQRTSVWNDRNLRGDAAVSQTLGSKDDTALKLAPPWWRVLSSLNAETHPLWAKDEFSNDLPTTERDRLRTRGNL